MATEDDRAPLDLSLEDTYRMLDVERAVRKRQAELGREIEFDPEAVKDLLRAIREESGEAFTEEGLDAAVEEYLAEKGRFKAPRLDLVTRGIATVYIHRVMVYVGAAVVAALAAATAVGGYGLSLVRENRSARAEERVEIRVEELYGEFDALLLNSRVLENDGTVAMLPSPKRIDFDRDIATAHELLEDANTFFDQHVDDHGQADDLVTRTSYPSVESAAASVAEDIEQARVSVGNAETLLDEKRQLDGVKSSLDSTIAEIHQAGLPAPFVRDADSAYRAGLSYVDQWNLPSARDELQTLRGVAGSGSEHTQLAGRVDLLCSSIATVVREPAVGRQAATDCADAATYVANGNMPALRRAIEALGIVEYTLQQDVELRRTRARLRGSMKNGVDRRSQVTGRVEWYVFTGAFDRNTGDPVEVYVFNEECVAEPDWCQSKGIPPHERVSVYGERITEETLDRIKRDIRTGSGETLAFGAKPLGHLEVQVNLQGYPEGRLGQITRW